MWSDEIAMNAKTVTTTLCQAMDVKVVIVTRSAALIHRVKDYLDSVIVNLALLGMNHHFVLLNVNSILRLHFFFHT